MTIPFLTADESAILRKQYAAVSEKTPKASSASAAASFLIITALIVIVSSCMTLSLPGVNAMQHVILPAVLPGCAAILLSIPLCVYSYNRNKEIRHAMGNSLSEQEITSIAKGSADDQKETSARSTPKPNQIIPLIQHILLSRKFQSLPAKVSRRGKTDDKKKKKSKEIDPRVYVLSEDLFPGQGPQLHRERKIFIIESAVNPIVADKTKEREPANSSLKAALAEASTELREQK